jgi:hypothetical protein
LPTLITQDRRDLGAILQQGVGGTDYAFVADPYPEQNPFFRSDNAVFARLGVPAHSLSTTPIDVDPDYHRVSGAATPTRIDPDGLD